MKRKYEKKSDIPAGLEDRYEERDGAWHFKGFDDGGGGRSEAELRAQLDGFRTKLREEADEAERLKSELAEAKGRLKEIDPTKYKAAMAALEKETDAGIRKLLEEGKYEEVVNLKSRELVEGLTTERDTWKKQAEQHKAAEESLFQSHAKFVALQQIREQIGLRKAQVRDKGAEGMLALRVQEDWTIDRNGKLIPKRKDLIGGNGVDPITPQEYVEKKLIGDLSFLFVPSTGGGGRGSEDVTPSDSGVRRIASSDQAARAQYNDDIAAGKAIVVPG